MFWPIYTNWLLLLKEAHFHMHYKTGWKFGKTDKIYWYQYMSWAFRSNSSNNGRGNQKTALVQGYTIEYQTHHKMSMKLVNTFWESALKLTKKWNWKHDVLGGSWWKKTRKWCRRKKCLWRQSSPKSDDWLLRRQIQVLNTLCCVALILNIPTFTKNLLHSETYGVSEGLKQQRASQLTNVLRVMAAHLNPNLDYVW